MINGNNGVSPMRIDFGKIKTAIQIPNLIGVQKKSYERFLQMDLLPSEREDMGLQSVLSSVFPINDFRRVSQLDLSTIRSATGSASAGISAASITCEAPARVAAMRSSPTPSKSATFSARNAELTTRTS